MGKRDSPAVWTAATVSVAVAVALFAIGLLAVVVLYVTPIVADGRTAPTWVYTLGVLAPIGLLVGVVGVVLGNRANKADEQ